MNKGEDIPHPPLEVDMDDYKKYINELFDELMKELGDSLLVNAMDKLDLTVSQKSDVLAEYDRWE